MILLRRIKNIMIVTMALHFYMFAVEGLKQSPCVTQYSAEEPQGHHLNSHA